MGTLQDAIMDTAHEERLLACALLIRPERLAQFGDAGAALRGADFTDKRLGVVFDAIRALYAGPRSEGAGALEAVTIEAIRDWAVARGRAEVDIPFLMWATDDRGRAGAVNVEQLAGKILDRSRRRELADAALKAAAAVVETVPGAEEQTAALMGKVQGLAARFGAGGGLVDFRGLLNGLINEVQEGRKEAPLISTGYRELDATIGGGFRAGSLVILAARPGVGKTTYAVNLIERAISVIRTDKPLAFFSLEMSKAEIMRKLMALVLRCRQGDIYDRKVWNAGALISFTEGLSIGAEAISALYLSDRAAGTVEEVVMQARAAALRYGGLRAVIVDYLQLLRAAGRWENRVLEVAAISRALKLLAQELGCVVIALSQLNRSSEKEARAARSSDLRDSGAIEQDADLILMLDDPNARKKEKGRGDAGEGEELPGAVDSGKRELRITKNRHGGRGLIRLGFAPEVGLFTEVEGGYEYAGYGEAARPPAALAGGWQGYGDDEWRGRYGR